MRNFQRQLKRDELTPHYDQNDRSADSTNTNVKPVQCRFDNAEQQAVSHIENKTSLPGPLKSGLEQLSGYDLSPVRVHYNSAEPAKIGALAYAQGTNIHLSQGQEKHLPHEGWHVVQQMQGRVRATEQYKGVMLNDDAGLEHEADVMGSRANTMATHYAAGDRTSSTQQQAGLIQQKMHPESDMPMQCFGPKLSSLGFYFKSLVGDLPKHVWRLIKHVTVGLGVTIVKILYHFGMALYEGFCNGDWRAFARNMAAALIGDALVWTLKLFAKVLDLLAFGEAMDLIMAVVKYNTRKMTPGEIAACTLVFGNKINYDQVRVDEHSLLNTHVFHFWVAFTTWHTVNWPNGSSFLTDPGTFIHEMAHIWQMERRGTQYIAEAPYGGGLNGAGYVYAVDRNFANIANGVALTADRGNGKTIWSYNLEQQAEICRHYYMRITTGMAIAHWQPFIDDIQGLNRMPLKEWLQDPAFLPWS